MLRFLRMLTNQLHNRVHWMLFSPGYCYVRCQFSLSFVSSFRVSFVIFLSDARLYVYMSRWLFFLSGCSGWPGSLTFLSR